jgi:GGDEF domain-containing protein/transposase
MTTPHERELERARASRERAAEAGDASATTAIDKYITDLESQAPLTEDAEAKTGLDQPPDPRMYTGVGGPQLTSGERKRKIGALEEQALDLGPSAAESKGRWGRDKSPEIFESSRRAEMIRQRSAAGGALNPLTDREQVSMGEVEAFERDERLPDAGYQESNNWRGQQGLGGEKILPGERLVTDPETGETRKAAVSPETLAERRISERGRSDDNIAVKTGTQQFIANRLRSEDEVIESRKLMQQTIFGQLSEEEQKRIKGQFPNKNIADISSRDFLNAVEDNPDNEQVLADISGDEKWESFKERWGRLASDVTTSMRNALPFTDKDAPPVNPLGATDPSGDVIGIESNLGVGYEGDKKAPLYPGASEHMQEYLNDVDSIHFYENVIQKGFKTEGDDGTEIMPGARLSAYVDRVRAEQYSPEAIEKKQKRFTAEDADWYNPFTWSDGNTALPWDDWDAFMLHVFENVPQIAVGIMSARIGGRGGAALAGRVHAGQKLSRIETMRRRAAGIGGAAAGGGSEGLLIHDAVKAQIKDEMDKLPSESFEKNAYYLSLIDAGMADEVARQIVTNETSRLGGKTAFVASGLLLGAPMGYVFGQRAAGRIGTSLAKEGALRTAGRIGVAGGGEMIQEGTQEVSEDVITNINMRAVDPERPIFDDVLNTFMGGAIIAFGPGALGGISRDDPAGLTKEDKQVMDATQDYMSAANTRYAFEARITSDKYMEQTEPQQRLTDLKKLEKLQEKEAKQLLSNQEVMRDHLLKKGGPTADTELKMLDRLVARANATLNDIAVARSRRTTSTQALEEYKREQSERKYIQHQIDQQVLEIHDVARLANNIDKIQSGEALTSPDEYKELVKQGWAKETTEGEFVILPKGARALNHLVQQHESLVTKLEKGYTGVDRRSEDKSELRKQMDAMTEDEFETAVYRRHVSGLRNRRAMEERVKDDPDAKHFAFADVDTLSWINDKMGHNAGDRTLMAIGEAMTEEEGNGITFYHISGDEFVASGPDEAAVQQAMQNVKTKIAKLKIKAGMDQITPTLTWGTGETVEKADAANNRMAEKRQQEGKRTAKGGGKPVGHKDIGSTQGVLLNRAPKDRSQQELEEALESLGYTEILGRTAPSLAPSRAQNQEQTERANRRIQQTKDLIDKGYTRKEVAEKIGVSLASVNAYMRVINDGYTSLAETKSKQRPRGQLRKVIPMMLDDGFTRKEISQLLGVSGHTVSEIVGETGYRGKALDKSKDELGKKNSDRINQLFKEGFTSKEIAEKTGLSRATVDKWRSADTPLQANRKKGRILIEEGNLSTTEIADQLGVHRNTVNQWKREQTVSEVKVLLHQAEPKSKVTRRGFLKGMLSAAIAANIPSSILGETQVQQASLVELAEYFANEFTQGSPRWWASPEQIAKIDIDTISPHAPHITQAVVKKAQKLMKAARFPGEVDEKFYKRIIEARNVLWKDKQLVLEAAREARADAAKVTVAEQTESQQKRLAKEWADVSDQIQIESGKTTAELEQAPTLDEVLEQLPLIEDQIPLLEDEGAASWSDIRRTIEIGDEVEIITPENEVITGTVSMVTRNRGRDRIKVFAGNHEYTFNPHKNWLIQPKNPTALPDLSLQAAINVAMPGSQPNVVPDVILGRVGREGRWYADMSAIAAPYEYPGETWFPPQQVAPRLPRATKKKMAKAEQVKNRLFRNYRGLPSISIWASWDDIPEKLQQAIYEEGGTASGTRGWFDHNNPAKGVHIILPNAMNATRSSKLTEDQLIERAVGVTLFHEIVGHFGIRGLVGNEPNLRIMMHQMVDSLTPGQRRSMINLLAGQLETYIGKWVPKSKTRDGYYEEPIPPQNRPQWKNWDERERRAQVQQYDSEKQLVGEEFIAYAVGENYEKLGELELTPKTKNIIQRFWQWLKDWLVSKGHDIYFHDPAQSFLAKAKKGERITDDDISALVARAQDFVRYKKEWKFTSLGGDTSTLVGRSLNLMRDGDIFQNGIVTAIEQGESEKVIWRTEKRDYIIKSKPDGTPNKAELKRIKKQVPGGTEVTETSPIFAAEGTMAEFKASFDVAVQEGYVTLNEIKVQRVMAFLENLSYADLATYVPKSSRDPWWLGQMEPVRERTMTAAKVAEWHDGAINADEILPEDKRMTVDEAYKVLLSQEPITWTNHDGTEHTFGGKDYDAITESDIEQLKALPSVLRRAYEQAQEKVLSDTKVGKRVKLPRDLLLEYMNGEKVVRVSFKTLGDKSPELAMTVENILGEEETRRILDEEGEYDLEEWVENEQIDQDTYDEIMAQYADDRIRGHNIGYNELTATWYDVTPDSVAHSSYMPHFEGAVPGSARNYTIQMYGRGPMYARDTGHSDHLPSHSFYGDEPVDGSSLGHMRTTLMYDADPNAPVASNPAHQGQSLYLGELQGNWFQYISQAFNTPEELASGKARVVNNFVTLIGRSRELSSVLMSKVKTELSQGMTSALTIAEKEAALMGVRNHFGIWDATQESEVTARLALADSNGTREEVLDQVLNEPVGKAFRLQLQARKMRPKLDLMLKKMVELLDDYPSLRSHKEQYVSDIRLHEALDSAAIHKYILELHQAIKHVKSQFDFADRNDNATEIADYLNVGLKHLDNWAREYAASIINTNSQSTHHTRLPSLLPMIQDVFQRATDAAGFSLKGLDDLHQHITKTGSRAITLPKTVLDDNGIRTTGPRGEDALEFFSVLTGKAIAAGANPDWDYNAELDKNEDIVINISAPLSDMDAATAFVPTIIKYYIENLYGDKWRAHEDRRINDEVQNSQSAAWRDANNITWDEMNQFAHFRWVDMENPDSWTDVERDMISRYGLLSKKDYIKKHIGRRMDHESYTAEAKISQAPMEDFSLEDGRVLSRSLPEYTALIDDIGNTVEAEAWLKAEYDKSKFRALEKSKAPGGFLHEQERKHLERTYDDDPPGMQMGGLPGKISEPRDGFRHGNIESEVPIFIVKTQPGQFWHLYIGKEYPEYHADKSTLERLQDVVARWTAEHIRYHVRAVEMPNAYDVGYSGYWQLFPNPFFDGSNVKTVEDIPRNKEPDWDATSVAIADAMGTPTAPEESGDSQFLFEESLRLNKKLHRGDWIPGMPISDEDVRALFLKGLIADGVRRGISRITWSGGLASTKRGGGWNGEWTNVKKITWAREKLVIRGQEKVVLVLQGDTVGSHTHDWEQPLVIDDSIQSLGTVLGYNEREAIMDQIKGKTKARVETPISPQESDLLISASSGGSFYLTLNGSNDILGQTTSREEAEEKKAELLAEAQERGGWANMTADSSVPTTSVFGGELLGSGAIHADEFGLTPMRVLIGQSLDQINPSSISQEYSDYIPTLDITTSNAVNRHWWYQKGARLSYDQLTYRAWDAALKKFNSKIEQGSILTSRHDKPFQESGRDALGETQVPFTPLDIVQQHGVIRVEPVAGQRQGFIVTGSNDLVVPQVYATREGANEALADFIDRNSGEKRKAAKVFQITINDEMRAHFAKPQPFLHYDPYEDPVLKAAADKIGSRLPRFRDRYDMWKRTWKDEAHQGIFDRFYGIKYALKRAEVWDELDAETNPWIQARFTTSLDSVMKAVLEYGAPVWLEGITQTKGKGLLELLQPVLGDVETWAMYMAGTRSRRLLLEGLTSLTVDEMKLVVTASNQYKGKTKEDKILALIADITAEEDSVALDDVTHERSLIVRALTKQIDQSVIDSQREEAKPLVQKIIDNGRERNWRPYEVKRMAELGDHFPHFKKVAADYATFNKAVLDYAEEAGIINPETRPLWENADYIPFYRVVDQRLAGAMGPGAGIANQHQQIKRLGGTEDNVGDLMHNIMTNLTNLVDASMKNHAARMTVDALKESGIVQKKPMTLEQKMVSMDQVRKKLLERGLNPESIPEDALEGFQKSFALSPPKGEGIISVMRNGKKEYYYTDDTLLYRSMSAINMQQFGEWMALFRAPKRLLTTMVTLDPGFMLANFVRDTASAAVLSRDHFIPVVGAVKGFGQALVKDEAMRTMLSAGAAFESGYINAYDPGATHRLLKRAQRKPGFAKTIIRTPKLAYEAYKALGSAVENSNRMAVYNAAIAAGKSKAQAAFEAKDLMDFSMGGDWPFIQFLIQTVPFMGARLQGIHRLGRGVHDHPVAFVTKGFLLMIAGLALWAAYRDDERYKELEDWDKDTYFHWWIGDRHFRLPKPFEVGAIFNTIPERIMEHHYSEENDAGKLLIRRLGFMMGETFSMSPIPQTIKPLMESYFNYNTFQGRSIVSPYEEQRMPPEQYRYSTSPTWVEMARLMPAGMDLASKKIRSPLHLQNLYAGYMGTLGRYLVMASDGYLRNQLGYPEPPDWKESQYPVLGRFIRGESPQRTRYEEEVYTLLRKVMEIQGSMRFLDKTEQFDRLEQIEEDWEKYIDIAPDLENIREDVQDLNREIMELWNDDKKDGAEKRIRMDKLQEDKNELFKEGWELRPGGRGGAGTRNLTMDDVDYMLDEFGVDDRVDAKIKKVIPETASLMQGIQTLGMKELERLAAITNE